MKKFLFAFLRIAIPVGFGIYLAWYFWTSMPQKDKDQVFDIFSRFNYFYIFLSLLFCWIGHYSRAVRWSYMLEPLGYKTNKWTNYHAVITGYFVNMVIPRGGEISRAGVLTRYENVPFEKAFGTIMAERVIDMIIMVTMAFITLGLQGEKYPEITRRYNELTARYKSADSHTGTYILIGLGVLALIAIVLYFRNEKIRNKVKNLGRGFADGVFTIIRLKKRWAFIGHSLLIWAMYLGLYWVCFLGIPETAHISPSGMMLGFLAGGISIILVPGGIGIYPVFVAAALSIYCNEYGLLYGIGWLAWLAQTGLIVIAGMISLYLVAKLPKKDDVPQL